MKLCHPHTFIRPIQVAVWFQEQVSNHLIAWTWVWFQLRAWIFMCCVGSTLCCKVITCSEFYQVSESVCDLQTSYFCNSYFSKKVNVYITKKMNKATQCFVGHASCLYALFLYIVAYFMHFVGPAYPGQTPNLPCPPPFIFRLLQILTFTYGLCSSTALWDPRCP
jgi:hypothetical protein